MSLTPEQKKKIQQIADVIDNGNIAVAKMIFELEDKIDKQIPMMKNVMERIRGKEGHTPTEAELVAIIKPMLPKVIHGVDGHTPTKQELLSIIKPLIPKVQDGHTPTKEELLDLIIPLIPELESLDTAPILEALKNDLPKLGTSVRDSLELLQGDERLEMSAIKDLQEELEKVKQTGGTHTVSTSNRGLYQLLDVNVTNITPNQSIKWDGTQWIPYTPSTGSGTVQTVAAGTGISVNSTDPANPIVTNTAPDQTVAISGGTGISATGTYPNFTITNTAPDQTVSITAGTNIDSVTGTYPNFTINASTQGGTYTLPTASDTVKGGIKIGSRLTMTGDVLSADIQSGGGDVVGPASAVDMNFVAFDSTTGKLIKDSGHKHSDYQPAGSYLTSANIEDTIVDGHTTIAPSSNAVFDALALKAPLTAPTFATSITGSYLTASEILITDASKNIVSAPVATYPSLTELTYVKGVTSGIQSQLNGKQATLTNPITGTGTVNEIAYFPTTSTVGSLPVATYPSLTELSYVKGVTSAIQTQLNAKGVGDMVLASSQSVTGLKTFDKDKIAMKGTSTGTTTISTAQTDASSYTQTLQARNGTIANQDDVHYIGTTSVALNRASAALTLAGITLTTPDIGTPSAGTLTNCTGLPVAGITASTSTALGVGSLELGHASDTTLTRVSAGVAAIEGATIATLSTAQTWTANQTQKQELFTINAITASGNAATVPITYRLHNVTNNSAATLTITLTTTSAVDGQLVMIRIYDFSAVAQTITWVNTEDSTVTAPITSNGSTTLPLTVGFQYNSATSKWRCIAKA